MLEVLIALEIIILKNVFRFVLHLIHGQIGKLIGVRAYVLVMILQIFLHIHKILTGDVLLL